MARPSVLYRRKSDLAMDLLPPLISVTPIFHDWKATLLFYSTLHRIQEYAVLRGDVVPKNHSERRRYVEESPPEVFDAYTVLCSMSDTARYDPEGEITADCVRYARDIRQYALGAIS